MTEPAPIVTTAQHLRYENDYVRVYDNDVTFPGGRAGTYLRIESAQDGRGVVALVQVRELIALVRTYRYPVAGWQWGLPRGFASSADSAITARREIKEELGIDAPDLIRIGTITPDSGLLSALVDVYRVTLPEVPRTTASDREEVYEVAWIPRTELARRIAAGELTDAFTLAALTLDRYHGSSTS